MDQIKKFLKIAVANRFWILCVVAALLPMIAYFVGSGKIVSETAAKAGEIESAYKGVDPYKSGKLPNPEWKSLAEANTAKLTSEINVAWEKLYKKQAPLLKWPLDRVEDKFRKWGRKHPEAMEASPDDVSLVIQDYVNFHPEYVTSIYKSFRPFDFTTGNGIVVSPPEAGLLRPGKFEISTMPKLDAIWKEQEKLWVSQAVLDVVNQVNKSAETWDAAPIKQILLLEVASDTALDPMSKTKGVELVDPPKILAPGEEAESAEAAPEAGGMMDMMAGYGAPGGAGGKGGMMGGMEGDMMGMGMGGMMGGGTGGTKTAADVVKFLAPPEGVENPPYFIVPILLTTLIEQDKVADLLVELENSPMAIQVMSLELAKPSIKVQKPEKGDSTMLGYGGMTGMMGMMGGRGGMMDGMEGMMGGYGMMGGPGMGGPGMGGRGGMMDMMGGPGMGGMMGGPGGEVRKGTDVRSKDRRKEREEAEKNFAKRARMSLQDPYYNVVEVSVYGQARFYNPPPPPEAQTSEGDAATPAPAAEGTTPAAEGQPTETQPKAEATPAADGQPKAEATPADANADPAEKAVPADGQPKAAEPTAEAPKF